MATFFTGSADIDLTDQEITAIAIEQYDSECEDPECINCGVKMVRITLMHPHEQQSAIRMRLSEFVALSAFAQHWTAEHYPEKGMEALDLIARQGG